MISWIQRTFAKHTKLVFLFLLLVITIPFVFTIGAAPGIGRAGNKILERPFFGVNLGNEAQSRRVFLDGALSAQLRTGYSLPQDGRVQQYSLQRIASLALADELHLPAPTADEVAKFVLTLRAFQNEQGQFDQVRYSSFADMLKQGTQVTTADVNRVLRDDVRIEAAGKLIGGPGYVLPGDVTQQLILTDSRWTAQVVTLDYAAFNPALPATDDVLKKFYDENSFRYDVPARPRLRYVEFKGTEFIPAAAPTEAELRAFYEKNISSFPVPPDPAAKKDAPPPPDKPADNFPKVRALVETTLKNLAGAHGASQAANDLTVALFERKFTANSPELDAFLAAQRHPAKDLAPFAPGSPPANMPWLGAQTEQISRLNKDRFFSDPVATTDSFIVLLWTENLPPYKPLFNEVRDRVATDYKDTEKRRLFFERGQALRAQLQAAAKTAAGFASAAAAEKLEVKTYANFTMQQRPADMPEPAFSALQGLQAGQVAEMAAEADKGYLVFAQEKKQPDLSPQTARYAEMQKLLMRSTAGAAENSYLGELIERELKKTEPATP